MEFVLEFIGKFRSKLIGILEESFDWIVLQRCKSVTFPWKNSFQGIFQRSLEHFGALALGISGWVGSDDFLDRSSMDELKSNQILRGENHLKWFSGAYVGHEVPNSWPSFLRSYVCGDFHIRFVWASSKLGEVWISNLTWQKIYQLVQFDLETRVGVPLFFKGRGFWSIPDHEFLWVFWGVVPFSVFWPAFWNGVEYETSQKDSTPSILPCVKNGVSEVTWLGTYFFCRGNVWKRWCWCQGSFTGANFTSV